MDVPDAQGVCRTCLKSINTKSSFLSLSDCCTPQKTYGQILEDYGQFEFKEEQEANLPQFLCALCCRQLKRVHSFISRAQICNLQLVEVAVGSYQLDCLKEEAIDLPVKIDGEDLTDCKEELTANENDNVVSKGNNVKYQLIPDGYCSNGEVCPAVELIEYEKGNSRSTTEQMDKEHHSHSDKYSKVFYDRDTDQRSMTSTCPLCSKVLKRRMYMLNHLRKVHHIDNAGNFLKKLKGKQKNHQVYGKLKCTQCGYTAKNSAALTYHSRTRHATESDKYKCKFCSFESLKRWALVRHIKNEHKLQFKRLKKSVEKKQSISEHETDSDSHDSSVQELSLEDSSDDDGFIRAMITEERRVIKSKYVDGEPYNSLARKCEDCGKIYKNFQSLYAHKRFVHISDDMYSVCLHCGKKYKRSQDLKNHILQSHANADISSSGAVEIPEVQGKRFICTECPYATTTTTHLKIHVRRHHTGEKPYVCEVCGNSFLTLYCLKKHSYLHTGEKPHKCPYCPKTFRTVGSLKKHKRVHTGERPYKCTECGKGFTQGYNLSVHKRIHNKNRIISLPVVM